jgi:hypothetical protein
LIAPHGKVAAPRGGAAPSARGSSPSPTRRDDALPTAPEQRSPHMSKGNKVRKKEVRKPKQDKKTVKK